MLGHFLALLIEMYTGTVMEDNSKLSIKIKINIFLKPAVPLCQSLKLKQK
jgi:hypothetical protein